jgi:DNA-binding beta-propeller fold protein YncE
MLRPFASRRLDSRISAILAVLALAGCSHRAPGERLFVSDDRGDMVVAVDMPTGGIAERIALGGRPRGMAWSPDHATLYVALSAEPDDDDDAVEADPAPPKERIGGVAAIDIASAKVTRLLPAGKDPVRVAVSSDGHRVFVSDQADGTVAVVMADGAGSPHVVPVCDTPEGIAPGADGKSLFIACVDSDRVAMLDTGDLHTIRKIRVRGGPRAALSARDGRHIYIATDNGRLAILSPDGKVEKTLDLTRDADDVRAAGMVEAPDGHLFVTTGRYGAIVEVDPTAGTIVRTIAHVGAEPMGIGISADGATLVTANGASGDVSLINRLSGKIVRKLNVGKRPWGIAARG